VQTVHLSVISLCSSECYLSGQDSFHCIKIFVRASILLSSTVAITH